MTSNNLNEIRNKIQNSSSTMNLYTNLTLNDRITLNSTPCGNNSTGSCKGLLDSFNPVQFQAFDLGRETYQTTAQNEDCVKHCMDTHLNNNNNKLDCERYCSINTRKDFI